MTDARSQAVRPESVPDWVLRFVESDATPESVLDVCRAFSSAPLEERSAFQHLWRPVGFKAWPDPFRLTCAKDGPGTCAERIRVKLIDAALTLPFERDPRDSLMALAVIYASCVLARLHPDTEFAEVARLVGSPGADFLTKFASSLSDDNVMERFRLAAAETPFCGGWVLSIRPPR
jgi:hypothetical protein